MFWRNKQSHSWIFVFFGLIAVGIIIAIVVLIFLLISKQSAVRTSISAAPEALSLGAVSTSSEQVFIVYMATMQSLLDRLQVEELSVEEVETIVEPVFLRARVPQEKREQHLKIFLQIQQMKSLGQIDGKQISDLIQTLF